jgi:hypothetical protein
LPPSPEVNRLLSNPKTNCNPEGNKSRYVDRSKGFVKKSAVICRA